MGRSEPEARQLLKEWYANRCGSSTGLFQAVLAVGEEIGLEAALGILESLVTEKRLSWLEEKGPDLARTEDPLADGYRTFFEQYLGLEIPRDGEIVEKTPGRLVIRWHNPCPTLEACRELGLDTRVICRKVYERPVQAFLERLDPRLRFRRNYDCIRPHAGFCEETIELVEENSQP